MGLGICIRGGHHLCSIQFTMYRRWWFMDGEDGNFLFHFFPFLPCFFPFGTSDFIFHSPHLLFTGVFFLPPSFWAQRSRFSSFSSAGGICRAILIVVELFGVTYYVLWRNGKPRHLWWKVCSPDWTELGTVLVSTHIISRNILCIQNTLDRRLSKDPRTVALEYYHNIIILLYCLKRIWLPGLKKRTDPGLGEQGMLTKQEKGGWITASIVWVRWDIF